jgi:hypothetical protein
MEFTRGDGGAATLAKPIGVADDAEIFIHAMGRTDGTVGLHHRAVALLVPSATHQELP